MSDEVIDLDSLAPEPKKIKLSGKVIDLYPGKLKTIMKLQKAFGEMSKGEGSMEEVIEILSVLVPRIKDDDIDISMPVLTKLVALSFEVSMPKNIGEASKANMTPTTEKKMEITSDEPSPTSSDASQDIS